MIKGCPSVMDVERRSEGEIEWRTMQSGVMTDDHHEALHAEQRGKKEIRDLERTALLYMVAKGHVAPILSSSDSVYLCVTPIHLSPMPFASMIK